MFERKQWREFLSLPEMVAHANEVAIPDLSAKRIEGKGGNFYCTKDWPEMMAMADGHGWPEGRERIAKLAQVIYARVTARMPVTEQIYREAPGDFAIFDVARVIEGLPETWIDTVETDETYAAPGKRLIHLVYNASVSCGVNPETVFARGAACCALAEALELAGRAVRITVVCTINSESRYNFDDPSKGNVARSADDRLEIRAVAKDYTARANYDVLAFTLCHPSFFRRIGFAEFEGYPEEVREKFRVTNWGHYGYPGDVEESERGDVYISSGHYSGVQWRDARKAEDWIIERLKEFGINID